MTNAMRRLELREKIQTAARTVFLEKGYAETKISDIAAAAGISPSTIYLYFSGKKELFSTLDIQHAAALRPDFERKREELCRAALVIFGEEGFERTTMDAVAEKVGLSKAALYQYCNSKEDLFLRVLDYYLSGGFRSPDDTRTDDDDWRDYLKVVAKSCLMNAGTPERNAFLGTVIRESNKFPAFGRIWYEHSYRVSRRNMLRFLGLQQERGLIRGDVNLRDCIDVFLGALMSYVVLYRTMGGVECDVDENTYINQTVDIFIRALEP